MNLGDMSNKKCTQFMKVRSSCSRASHRLGSRYILALAELDFVHRGYPWTGIPRMTRLHPHRTSRLSLDWNSSHDIESLDWNSSHDEAPPLIPHHTSRYGPEILRTCRLDPGYSSSCIEVRSLDSLGLVEARSWNPS